MKMRKTKFSSIIALALILLFACSFAGRIEFATATELPSNPAYLSSVFEEGGSPLGSFAVPHFANQTHSRMTADIDTAGITGLDADNSFAHIYTQVYGWDIALGTPPQHATPDHYDDPDEAFIVGTMNTVAVGHLFLYCYSTCTSVVKVCVGNPGSGYGDWIYYDETVIYPGNAQWVYFGYRTLPFTYLAVCCIAYPQGNALNSVYVSAVRADTWPEYPPSPPNWPPETPTLNGPSPPTYTCTLYQFSAVSTDPNGDTIRYTFNWGDGASTTTSYYASGQTAYASHSWYPGTYQVTVTAQDSTGLSSSPSNPITVNILPPPTHYLTINVGGPDGISLARVDVDGTPYQFSSSITLQVSDGMHEINAYPIAFGQTRYCRFAFMVFDNSYHGTPSSINVNQDKTVYVLYWPI